MLVYAASAPSRGACRLEQEHASATHNQAPPLRYIGCPGPPQACSHTWYVTLNRFLYLSEAP
jgi:hypothetical protein